MASTEPRTMNVNDWLKRADLLAGDAKAAIVAAFNSNEDHARLRVAEAHMLAMLAQAATTAALAAATRDA